MRTLVIYDSTGRIWTIVHGAEELPQGLTCMWVDIPDGAQLDHINVTDASNPQPVFAYLPESDIGRLQEQVVSLGDQLTEAQLALTEQYEANLALAEEVTNTQLALTEIYEGMEV